MGIFVLQHFIQQIVLTVGLLALAGWIISIFNQLFYKNMGFLGRPICYITGIIGTPIHEGAHALMCLIFGHKILEIKFFQMSSDDGTLGYVKHSYNPNSVYQKIGNFFIGIAPIIVITAILYLLACLLLPDMVTAVNAATTQLSSETTISKSLEVIGNIVLCFLSSASKLNWWIFVVIGSFLSLHMTLSKADIKGALGGLIVLLFFVFLLDVMFGILMWFRHKPYLLQLTNWCYELAGFIICFMLIAVIVSLATVGLSVIIKFILKKRGIRI